MPERNLKYMQRKIFLYFIIGECALIAGLGEGLRGRKKKDEKDNLSQAERNDIKKAIELLKKSL